MAALFGHGVAPLGRQRQLVTQQLPGPRFRELGVFNLDQLVDVGEVEVNTFSVEKVIALKPDLVILGDWQVKGIGADFNRLVSLGIPSARIEIVSPGRWSLVQNSKLSVPAS